MKRTINTRSERIYIDPDFSQQPYHSINAPIRHAADDGGISFGTVIVVVFIAVTFSYLGYLGLQWLGVIR